MFERKDLTITREYKRHFGEDYFFDWAPSVIIEYYKAIKLATLGKDFEKHTKKLFGEDEYSLLNLQNLEKVYTNLITHPIMEDVWTRLHSESNIKKSKQHYEKSIKSEVLRVLLDLDPDARAEGFGEAVFNGLYGMSEWEKLTPKERETEFRQLIKLLESVSGKLKRFKITEGVLKVFSLSEFKTLHNNVIEHHLDEGFLRSIGEKLKDETVIDDLYESLDEKKENLDYNRLIDNIYRSTYNYINKPSLPEILDRYSKVLKENPPYEEALTSKPNSKNARKVYFIRTLSQYNVKTYGSPLYQIIAKTASVFFDDVSEGEVRASLRVKN